MRWMARSSFTKAAEWFNKVPFPDEDKAAGVDKLLAQFGIVHGQPFDYSALSLEKKTAMGPQQKSYNMSSTRLQPIQPVSATTSKVGLFRMLTSETTARTTR
jgi:hypothetical protein